MKKHGMRPALMAALLTTVAATPPAQAAMDITNRIAFVPTSLTEGQNVRVTLVNLRTPPNPNGSTVPPGPCRAQVTFFDEQGNAVGDPEDVTIPAGESRLVSAQPPGSPETPPGPSIRTLRATILFPSGPPDIPPGPCRDLHAGFEVYDTSSGATLFMNPGAVRGPFPTPW